MTHDKLTEIYETLIKYFGPQHWWPGQTQFEIMVGAILTQNTNWSNVEKAIKNLKAANCLTPDALHEMEIPQLAELIRPAGYFRVKAARLKNFIQWLFDNYAGQISNIT